jgi:crotonobetainyl-CoA:carnitine CoA-transferase CaiB-like acyl-CoA transferase
LLDIMLSQAYAGVRVVELATTIAGPFCAMILADLGADVIKVERPDVGDDARSMPPLQDGKSAVFAAVNRNKRSVVLDLQAPEGRDDYLRLCDRADVVVESLRPGVATKLGIDFDVVSKRNDDVVYCAISAFGRSGPMASRAGYDPLVQAFTGLMKMTGERGGDPVRVAASLTDLTTGMWAAMGAMAGLAKRSARQEPVLVDATLVDAGLMLLCHQISSMAVTGEPLPPSGSASPIAAPYEAFRTSDDWIMIAAGNATLFQRLCEAVGQPELVSDERFSTMDRRVAHRHELHELLASRLTTGTAAHWIEILAAAGVPAGPVNDLAQAVSSDLVRDRGLLIESQGFPLVRLPITPAPDGKAHVPELGEHTTEVLAELG